MKERALVLAGGGVLGIAWETGIVAGLVEAGVHLLSADLIVGTSAGSTVAAQISSAPVDGLYRRLVEGSGPPEPVITGVDFPALNVEMVRILTETADPIEARKAIGRISLARDRVPEQERRALIEARLPRSEWPDRELSIPAIHAETGELAVFDRASGVELIDAVAASSAVPGVWPAVTIDGERYYDGGVRSSTNTDLALGYERVLVLKVMDMPECADVVDISSTSEVRTIDLDDASRAALGGNVLDPAHRAVIARAGWEQGRRIADDIGRFW